MDEWIEALAEQRRRGEPCILVTLVDELGPRRVTVEPKCW